MKSSKFRSVPPVCALLIALGVLGGCGKSEPPPTTPAAGPTATVSGSTAPTSTNVAATPAPKPVPPTGQQPNLLALLAYTIPNKDATGLPSADQLREAFAPCQFKAARVASQEGSLVSNCLFAAPEPTDATPTVIKIDGDLSGVTALHASLNFDEPIEWVMKGFPTESRILRCAGSRISFYNVWAELEVAGKRPVSLLMGYSAGARGGTGELTLYYERREAPAIGSKAEEPGLGNVGEPWQACTEAGPAPERAVEVVVPLRPSADAAAPSPQARGVLEQVLDRRFIVTDQAACAAGTYQVFTRKDGNVVYVKGQPQLGTTTTTTTYTPNDKGFDLLARYGANDLVRKAVGDVPAGEVRSVVKLASPQSLSVSKQIRTLNLSAMMRGEVNYDVKSESSVLTVCELDPPLADGPAVSAALAPPAKPQQVAGERPSASLIELDKCVDAASCVNVMVTAAMVERLAIAMDAARRIDGLAKPVRGDRKLARKLNEEGLDALRQRKIPDAIALFAKARNVDPSDEEVIGNLVYAYVEDGNFAKASALAVDGLLLNPRRANMWLPYAVSRQGQANTSEGLAALWLAWQFSTDKEKMLKFLDAKIADEKTESMRSFFASGRAWVIDNKRPADSAKGSGATGSNASEGQKAPQAIAGTRSKISNALLPSADDTTSKQAIAQAPTRTSSTLQPEYSYPKGADGCPLPNYAFPPITRDMTQSERLRRCLTNANAFCFQGAASVEGTKEGCHLIYGK